MEFITGICPKCQGVLQIPSDRVRIICMYCGEEIEASEAIQNPFMELQKERLEETQQRETESEQVLEKRQQYEIYAKQAFEQFPQMLFAIEDPLKNFKKGQYEPAFRAYQVQNKEIMNAVEDAYLSSKEPEQFLNELTKEFVKKVNETLAGQKKRRQEELLMNYNMSLVIYVNPALIDFNKTSGRLFAEELLRQWKTNFPKTNIKIADFDSINAGFKKRFCYITTAVCESLNKPDDCYELNLLREYRDTYLMSFSEGEALVQKYYDVAPTIVKHINRQPQSDSIYQGIWQEYLFPCIQLIENNKNEQCRVLYQDMVDTLTRQYFN